MKDADTRNKTLTKTLLCISLRYYNAFKTAGNTYETLKQLLDAFDKSAANKEYGASLGKTQCPIRLMEILIQGKQVNEKYAKNILPLCVLFIVISFMLVGLYSFLCDPAMSLPWFMSAVIGYAIVPYLVYTAHTIGQWWSCVKLVQSNSAILYDFIDSLQSLGHNFAVISPEDRFQNDTEFGSLEVLRVRAHKRLILCAKWVLFCTRECGQGSFGKYGAERFFALTHTGLLRIGLAEEKYNSYYDQARRQISEYEGTENFLEDPDQSKEERRKIFTMEKPTSYLLP